MPEVEPVLKAIQLNTMKKQQIFLPLILGVFGLVVWIVVSQVSHQKEAWDSGYYFQIGLPLMFAASAVAGYLKPGRPWRWGLFVFALQPIALFLQSQEGPLVVVGLFFFLLFAAVAVGCAYIGSIIRHTAERARRDAAESR